MFRQCRWTDKKICVNKKTHATSRSVIKPRASVIQSPSIFSVFIVPLRNKRTKCKLALVHLIRYYITCTRLHKNIFWHSECISIASGDAGLTDRRRRVITRNSCRFVIVEISLRPHGWVWSGFSFSDGYVDVQMHIKHSFAYISVLCGTRAL